MPMRKRAQIQEVLFAKRGAAGSTEQSRGFEARGAPRDGSKYRSQRIEDLSFREYDLSKARSGDVS